MKNVSLTKLVNFEVEETVIARIIVDTEYLFEAASILKPQDFAKEENRQVFQFATKCLRENKEFSPLTLPNSELKSYTRKLLERAADYDSYRHNAIEVIREASIRRQYNQISSEINELTQKGEFKQLKASIAKFFVVEEETKEKILTPENTKNFYLDLIEKRANPASGLAGIPYQLSLLQAATLGIHKGEFIIVAARPSIGKSALLENIGYYQAKKGFKILFASAEMTKEAILDRQVARIIDCDPSQLKKGFGKDHQLFYQLKNALEKRKNFYIWDSGSMTTLALRAKIHQMKMTTGIDVVLVDYLQKLSGQGKTEYERVSAISRELKAIAMDLGISVVVACQYNRTADAVQPQLSDLRDSGQIEQDADVVISLWRTRNAEETTDKLMVKTHLDLLKNRNGRTFAGDYELWFHKKRTEFFEIDKYDQPTSVI